MEKKVLNFIEEHHMLEPGDRVIVGLSGGADSVCLLRLLCSLKRRLQIDIRAVHIHHGLRGKEADRDARFSEEVCKGLGIACTVKYISAAEEAEKLKISVEEAGRAARYRIMEHEALRWEKETGGKEGVGTVKIATAHHGNDSAETILYHLFRGSGLKGLGGIAPIRGRIIRPILWAERGEVLAYLEQNSQEYMEDSTNKENEYTRNKLRNQLIPFITEEVNKKAVQNILRAAEQIGEADQYFEKKASECLKKIGKNGENRIRIRELLKEEPIIQRYVIRCMMTDMGCPLKDVTSAHLESVLKVLKMQTGKGVNLPNGIWVEKEYEYLKIVKHENRDETRQGGGGQKKENGLPELKFETVFYKNGDQILENQYTKWFDYDKIKGTLSVRTRQPGDFIMLPSGGRKTIKSFMIDEKIPREKRNGILLLADGNHILWIVGYRISEYYKVTEHTKTILKVQLDGGSSSG